MAKISNCPDDDDVVCGVGDENLNKSETNLYITNQQQRAGRANRAFRYKNNRRLLSSSKRLFRSSHDLSTEPSDETDQSDSKCCLVTAMNIDDNNNGSSGGVRFPLIANNQQLRKVYNSNIELRSITNDPDTKN